MKKVLIITSTFPRWNNDNIPRFVLDFAKTISNNFEIDVLAPHFKDSQLHEVLENIEVYRFVYFFPLWEKLTYGAGVMVNIKKNPLLILLFPFLLFFQFWWFTYLCIKNKYKVINVHWITPNAIVPVLLKRLFKYEIVTNSHGADVYDVRKFTIFGFNPVKFTNKWLLRRIDRMMVVSNSMKELLVNEYEVALEQITVAPMGANVKDFGSIKKEYKSAGIIKLIFVGRLVQDKGVFELVQALDLLLKRGMEYKLSLVGTGPELPKLKEYIEIHKLNKNVKLEGFVDHGKLPELLASADIFVGPSVKDAKGREEGFGLTYLEAMSVGLPIIATNSGGVSDIVKEGMNGYLIESNDPENISKAIIKLSDREEIEKLGRNSKKIAGEYDWSQLQGKYVQAIGP